jgi:predicted TIM-barrel fold metal-dependent hydrolase
VLDFERTRTDFDAIALKPEVRRKVLRDNALRLYRL